MTAPDPRLEEIEGLTSAAVVAAAKVILKSFRPAHADWDEWTDDGKDMWEEYAREALEAAAPHMNAYLLAELRKAQDALDDYVARFGQHTSDNQGRDCPACNAQIRVKKRAAVAAAERGGADACD